MLPVNLRNYKLMKIKKNKSKQKIDKKGERIVTIIIIKINSFVSLEAKSNKTPHKNISGDHILNNSVVFFFLAPFSLNKPFGRCSKKKKRNLLHLFIR